MEKNEHDQGAYRVIREIGAVVLVVGCVIWDFLTGKLK